MPNTPSPTQIYLPLSVKEHKPEKDGRYTMVKHDGSTSMSKCQYKDGVWVGCLRAVRGGFYTHFLQPCERIVVTPAELEAYRKEVAKEEAGKAWVSVEEGLPESGKSVLIHWKNELGYYRISKGFYADKFSVEDDCEENHDGYSEYSEEKDKYYYPKGWVETAWEIEMTATLTGVTHWQPLPSPPDKPISTV
jgi:hypothetical protein